ncbi:laminin subunit alpha-2-like isoform X2 [Littorina saxatilis]|uniref:Laminin subunit alpha-2 n=1 Tax=Littorina saxatilis TaxID=31220 RepID=A0AAN9G9P0_9CAEN
MGSEAGDRKRRGSHSADMSVKINTECSCGWICVVAATVFYVSFGLAAAQQPNAGDRGNADQDTRGLFPVVFNLATRARISANATCGEREPEVFCKLVEHVRIFPAENRHCDICDARSENPMQRHPISNAIDGSNAWWQSPPLTNGETYNDVTITLDLGSIYQVAYVIVKAANSPRPGNWILERSLDGQTYEPWQYFAMTDDECYRTYGIRATVGVPTNLRDDQVICTSRYSKLDPLEGGEIFVSIVNGRPGVFQPSRVLLDFTSARYVQLRLQRIRTLNADLMFFEQFSFRDVDPSVTRRYFYSIKDISIGGQCICYGHATYCRRRSDIPDRFQCQCQHNTGGDNCEQCLPLFNQKPWRTGGIQGLGCEACNCHGKAMECAYNATVDAEGSSLNMEGSYEGGGVCLNCQEFTMGINCERCLNGYYRPGGYAPTAPMPCRPCNCRETATSTSQCVPDDSRVDEGLNPGDCICKPGFGGADCRGCAFGYSGYPNCRPCPCNPAGSVDPKACNQPCRCKANVGGRDCGQCLPGYFNLDRNNPDGCMECFCFGVTTQCASAGWGLSEISHMDDWVLSTLEDGGLTLLARRFNGWLEAKTYLLDVNNIDVNISPTSTRYTPNKEVHYWLAPMMFLGNRMSSYGGRLKYTVKFTLDGNLADRFHLPDPDLILRGSGMTIAHGRQYKRENLENMVSIRLTEDEWYHLENRQPVTRQEFMTVLYSLQQLMIKATYHTAQDTVFLRDVSLDVASPLVMSNRTLTSVEQCQCPEGYAGLSCESCTPGWRRESNQLYAGVCRRCECYNHASECDPNTGACQACRHNTAGTNCDQCLPGFYGDPRRGREDDCKPCACPLIAGNNFFAESCIARPTLADREAYECANCQEGYMGVHCERCSPGYYGDPTQPGGMCRRCSCGGNIDPSIPGSCDRATGACNICASNTEGDYCERCRSGYFGSARNGDCQPCACDRQGSSSDSCDQRTGRCDCQPRFVGRQCERCQPGYGDVSQGCVRCSCSGAGSVSRDCDPVSGQCRCRPGIGGKRCDQCASGYFGFSQRGCQRCDCYTPGTNNITQCDPRSGRCLCQPNVVGQRCDTCQVGFYGVDSGQGCRQCGCDSVGSTSYQCDQRSGQCPCRPGVTGRDCAQCQPGYYGFSSAGCQRCQPCNKPGHVCDPNTGECACPPNTMGPNCERCVTNSYNFNNDQGCKTNVEGEQCDRCAPGTFSLQRDNPKGCTECYCFFRSQECMQAPYIWSTITVDTRRVTISPQAREPVVVMDGYLVINSTQVYVDPAVQTRPLYWSMPAELLGDKTVSYNGRLDFIHFFDAPVGSLGTRGTFPLVVLRGNGFELHGDVTALEPNHAESFSIKLHESNWRLPGQQPPVSRRLMMVVLQNVTAILIRATQDGSATYAEIGPIGLEVAEPDRSASSTDIVAYGVEQCECPDRYSGLSCQNPAPGYFRTRPNPGQNFQTPENAIGNVRPCQCYSHSNVCHPETGVCKDCMHNTTGDRCDFCAPGFYGIATRGSPYDCAPCACPLTEPSNNFSPTCRGVGSNLMCTNCSEGHTGSRCERCEYGYYGNPAQLGGKCRPCNCAPEGSLDSRCDPVSGQCRCRSGIQGLRCDGCPDPGQGVQNGVCVSCYEGCTGELLTDLQNLTVPYAHINVSGLTYPWEEVYRIRNETQRLRDRMDALKSTSLDGLKDMKNQVDFYTNVTDNLHNRAVSICGEEMNFTNSRVGNVRMKTNETLHNATDIEKIVDELFKEIKGNISQLRQLVEKLYYNQTGLNVTAALQQAQDILQTILARDFTAEDDEAKAEIMRAEKLSERVRILAKSVTNTTNTANAITEIRKTLNDLYYQSQLAQANALEVVDERSQKLGGLMADLEDKVLDLNEMKGDTDALLKEGQDLIDEAEAALQRLEENILVLQRELSSLNAATEVLERRFDVLRDAMPGLEKLYRDVWKHALDLEKMAAQLEQLFDKVRNLAADPTRAARAYESIIQSIKQAEEAAKRAQKIAQETVETAKLGDLEEEVRQSLERSRRLLREAEQLLDERVEDLAKELGRVKTDFSETEDKHKAAADLLAMLLDGLNRMPQGFRGRLNDIVRKVDQAVERANEANKTVTDIQHGINTDLLPKLKQLEDFDINAIIRNVDKNFQEARKEAQKITTGLPVAKQKGQENMREALSIATKISDLRRKIDEARNITNSMKMSLSGEGNCVRSYRSQLSPGVSNEIRMGVKLNRTGVDMLLLLLQESPQEYLALEIRDNKVRFSWDVGKGPGSVTHDLKLKVFDANLDEEEKWYLIVAKRVGPIGQLKVWPVTGDESKAKEVSGKSLAGLSLMNFNRNTFIYFAGVPDTHQAPPQVTKSKLYGCVGDITIDGDPVGVYNFKTSDGKCKGCSIVPKLMPSTSVYTFNGLGYARLPITSFIYRADRSDITVEFKTFWENSRILFAGNSQAGDFVSIDLVGGKVLVQYYLGGMSKASQETSMTYNSNQWTSVQLQRRRTKANLKMYVEGQTSEDLNFEAPGLNNGLELLSQFMYIGGLPNDFPIEKFTQKDVKQNGNFLGCMRNVKFSQPQDLVSGVFVGLTPGCKDSDIRQVGFNGDGYVMFDGVSLGQQEADISLSFFTSQPNALLMLARDVSTDFYYSVALTDGKLEARLSANSRPTILTSKETYDDNVVHHVGILKNGRQLQLLVDDVIVAQDDLPPGVEAIPMGTNSNLYFGGASIMVNDMAASDVYLDGCVSDVIANGRLIDLSKAKQYSKADIGRCRDSVTLANGDAPAMCEKSNGINNDRPSSLPLLPPRPRTTKRTTTVIATTAAPLTTASGLMETSTCSPFRLMNAGIEQNAKTLGNGESSYAQISKNIRRSELRKNFNISFEFRTFFDDGLLGLLRNNDQSVYFAAQLRGGTVEVVYTFKGQEKRLRSTGNLADGQWHSGQIIKEKTKLRLEVDGQLVKTDKIESRLEIELPLYIGSVPRVEDLQMDVIKHSLRGCVRNLHLSGRPVDIADTDVISGVEHCYVSVEPGVGLTSNSWGIYGMDFDVGTSMKIEAEFKTSKREGVLLTIASDETGLTLELHEGKLMFALTNGDETIRAESNNLDPNEFCMNQWHTVRASLNNNTLHLKVDNQGEIVGLGQPGGGDTPSKSPLLIGGFPSTFEQQPASLSQQGFYGCMRNFVINNQQLDWYQLEITSSLLRTACPL